MKVKQRTLTFYNVITSHGTQILASYVKVLSLFLSHINSQRIHTAIKRGLHRSHLKSPEYRSQLPTGTMHVCMSCRGLVTNRQYMMSRERDWAGYN